MLTPGLYGLCIFKIDYSSLSKDLIPLMLLKATSFQESSAKKNNEIYSSLFFTAGLVFFVGLNKSTIDVAKKLFEHQNN